MSLRWIEGFETYVNGRDIVQVTRSVTSNITLAVTSGRVSGQACSVNYGNNANPGYVNFTLPATIAGAQKCVFGAAFNMFSAPTSLSFPGMGLIVSNSDGTYQFCVVVNTSGGISVYRGNMTTLLGSSAANIIQGQTWTYIEVEYILSSTAGTVNVYLNGSTTAALSLTGVNNAAAGTTNLNTLAIGVGVGAASTVRFDDMYFLDNTGSQNTAKLGDVRVAPLTVNAAVGTPGFTAGPGAVPNLIDPAGAQTSSSQTISTDQLSFTPATFTPGYCTCKGQYSTGQYYFEYQLSNTNALGMVGLIVAGQPFSWVAGTSATSGIAHYGSSGVVFLNNTTAGNTGFTASTNVVGVAVDFDKKLIWYRNVTGSGNWNGSSTANPATGVGGYSFSALGSGPFRVASSTNVSYTITYNFGQNTYSGTAPSGFGNMLLPASPTNAGNAASGSDDAGYNSAASVGLTDTFSVSALSYNPTQIFGVKYGWAARRDDGATSSIQAFLTSGTTQTLGTAQSVNTTYTMYESTVFELDPSTQALWTQSGVNAIKLGYTRTV